MTLSEFLLLSIMDLFTVSCFSVLCESHKSSTSMSWSQRRKGVELIVPHELSPYAVIQTIRQNIIVVTGEKRRTKV